MFLNLTTNINITFVSNIHTFNNLKKLLIIIILKLQNREVGVKKHALKRVDGSNGKQLG